MGKSKKKLKNLNKILNIYTGIGLFLWAIATILILVPSFPYLWYRMNTDATEQDLENITLPTETRANPDISFTDIISKYDEEPEEDPLPEFDATLPKRNLLIIPSIGVNGNINEDLDSQKALTKGVWRVNDYGTPEDETAIILASHRFGYITWTNDFRTKNSFYNLPKTKTGDKIQIIWNQRQYEYEIYKAEENTAIKDYDADLILYTCRMFNSPIRIFRYARRVN